jgi:hypothetical protein
LKQQKEKTNCLIKLITLRASQNSSNSKETNSNLACLNKIKFQLEARLLTLENERKIFKKKQKELNESKFETTSNRWNKKQFNSTLNSYEMLINANLFGSTDLNNIYNLFCCVLLKMY